MAVERRRAAVSRFRRSRLGHLYGAPRHVSLVTGSEKKRNGRSRTKDLVRRFVEGLPSHANHSAGQDNDRAALRRRAGRRGPGVGLGRWSRAGARVRDRPLVGQPAGLRRAAGPHRRFPERSALADRGVHGGRTVSPPLGILCAEPGRGVPRDSLRAWRSTPTPPAVEAAERPAVGSGGCSEEEGLGRGCRRRGPEGVEPSERSGVTPGGCSGRARRRSGA